MNAVNIAIFGGSFDPPHSGHRAIIRAALECDFIDLLIILPSAKNPLKKPPFWDFERRVAALEIMVREIAKDSAQRVKIYKKAPKITQITGDSKSADSKTARDSQESRDSKPQKAILISTLEQTPSFSIDSILHFKQLYAPKNLYFIIGADILGELHKWHRIDEITRHAKFIVATRGEIPVPSEFLQFQIAENVSSTALRAQLQNDANENFKDFVAESAHFTSKAEHLDTSQIDDKNARNRLESIIDLLDSKKAEDIALFDLRQTPYITSFVVIATSLADKHSFALLDTLKTELKAHGEVFYSTDEDSGDWIIADLGDIMIHIFTHNHRKKFNLEEFLSNYKKGVL